MLLVISLCSVHFKKICAKYILPGPFTLTVDRASAVDFTTPNQIGYYTAAVPLKQKSKMWYIADPFTFHVWLTIILSMALHLVTMGLTDVLYYGSADWGQLCGFILRNALSEQNSRMPNNSKIFQKILIITWLWSVLVLVQAYAGSLTAMLAKPILPNPIRTLEELLGQNEMSWVIEKGTIAEYFTATAAPGSVMKQLSERATIMSPLTPQERMMYGCFTSEIMHSRRYATICDKGSLWSLLAQDFTETGMCNFYLLNDKFLSSKASYFAVQVTWTENNIVFENIM